MATNPERLKKQFDRKREIAERLSAATNGKFSVDFNPECFFLGDRAAKGHLFSGRLNIDWCETTMDEASLDDRKPDLLGQLESEIKIIINHYRSIIKDIESFRATQPTKFLAEITKK